jgi:hypothetical protein
VVVGKKDVVKVERGRVKLNLIQSPMRYDAVAPKNLHYPSASNRRSECGAHGSHEGEKVMPQRDRNKRRYRGRGGRSIGVTWTRGVGVIEIGSGRGTGRMGLGRGSRRVTGTRVVGRGVRERRSRIGTGRMGLGRRIIRVAWTRGVGRGVRERRSRRSTGIMGLGRGSRRLRGTRVVCRGRKVWWSVGQTVGENPWERGVICYASYSADGADGGKKGEWYFDGEEWFYDGGEEEEEEQKPLKSKKSKKSKKEKEKEAEEWKKIRDEGKAKGWSKHWSIGVVNEFGEDKWTYPGTDMALYRVISMGVRKGTFDNKFFEFYKKIGYPKKEAEIRELCMKWVNTVSNPDGYSPEYEVQYGCARVRNYFEEQKRRRYLAQRRQKLGIPTYRKKDEDVAQALRRLRENDSMRTIGADSKDCKKTRKSTRHAWIDDWGAVGRGKEHLRENGFSLPILGVEAYFDKDFKPFWEKYRSPSTVDEINSTGILRAGRKKFDAKGRRQVEINYCCLMIWMYSSSRNSKVLVHKVAERQKVELRDRIRRGTRHCTIGKQDRERWARPYKVREKGRKANKWISSRRPGGKGTSYRLISMTVRKGIFHREFWEFYKAYNRPKTTEGIRSMCEKGMEHRREEVRYCSAAVRKYLGGRPSVPNEHRSLIPSKKREKAKKLNPTKGRSR